MRTLRSRSRGLDGCPFRAQQWDVTPKRNIVMALALAVAVTPAVAAERGPRAAPRTEQRGTAPQGPTQTSPLRDVLESLERLRLHPGQDSLDAAATARKRPEQPAD